MDKPDSLIENLMGMCAFNCDSKGVSCALSNRKLENYCTPCLAAERLKVMAEPRPQAAAVDLRPLLVEASGMFKVLFRHTTNEAVDDFLERVRAALATEKK